MDKIISFVYDGVLLDIMLPDGNGLELLQKLKSIEKADRVIIISAKDSTDDKVEGLEPGTDNSLIKPFYLAELNARIKTVIRRSKLEGRRPPELENVKINLDERSVFVAKAPMEKKNSLNPKDASDRNMVAAGGLYHAGEISE